MDLMPERLPCLAPSGYLLRMPVAPETIRTLVDLVEVDGKLLTLLAPTEADLATKPGLAQLLAQRLYLLERLERE